MASTPMGRAVAEVITDRCRADGISHYRLSELTGIPRTTLARRLGDGDFNITELLNVARELNTTPEALLADARRLTEALTA